MFAKKQRLPHYQRLVSPKVISSQFFIIKYRDTNLGINRFAVSISKRIDKRSVVRNRLRRVLQHCLSEIVFSKNTSIDMLIIVTKPFQQLSIQEVSAILISLFEKEGLV